MNHKKFWWSVGAVWLVMMVTDFLFHGVWLAPLYEQTSSFWRSQSEMQKMMPAMWIGQLFFSLAFVWIYTKGISKDNQWHQAFRYAFAILLVAKVPEQLVWYASTPLPGELVVRWFLIATVQAMAAAFVLTWVFKPLRHRG